MMKVDGLPAGRSQPFYHVLVDAAWPKLSTTYGGACLVMSLCQKPPAAGPRLPSSLPLSCSRTGEYSLP